jgi:predicted DNA-binding transcriptional regulator AlpA
MRTPLQFHNRIAGGDLKEGSLLTRVEAGDYLGVTKWTLMNWHRRGQGPRYFKLSHGTVRYRQRDLEAFLRKCQVRPERAR